LKSSLRQFYGLHHDLVTRYGISVLQWSRVCSVYRNHNPILSVVVTCHRVCSMTGATREAETAHPSRAPEFYPCCLVGFVLLKLVYSLTLKLTFVVLIPAHDFPCYIKFVVWLNQNVTCFWHKITRLALNDNHSLIYSLFTVYPPLGYYMYKQLTKSIHFSWLCILCMCVVSLYLIQFISLVIETDFFLPYFLITDIRRQSD
jgi:hypothetical protein